MVIGVPKEIKDGEFRIAMTPSGVRLLVEAGHRLLIEAGAGEGSGFPDAEYRQAGAELVEAAAVWARAELIVKVKEPQPDEYGHLRQGQALACYLHLAADKPLLETLLARSVIAIGYETVQTPDGSLPLLKPMSEIAGRMSVLIGAFYLQRGCGGRGVLLAGAPGVPPGSVVILGSGVVGTNAARIATGLMARVTVLGREPDQLRRLEEQFMGRVVTRPATPDQIEAALCEADLAIGAVHVPGQRTPRLVPRGVVAKMKRGAVIVDVSVDQGGCFETIRSTMPSAPVYEVEGVLHYGVANIPGAVPRTATFALTHATLSVLLELAGRGIEPAIRANPALASGVNTSGGRVVHRGVAASFGLQAESF